MSKKENTLPIVEIFTSIQGEGKFSGTLTTFIRTAGCNLSCTWCDTKYSWDAYNMLSSRKLLTVNEIVKQIKSKLVIITGGEPTIHNLKELIDELKDKGYYVAIETNGTREIPEDWMIDWVTCSPKPDSNYDVLCKPNELKYVVDDNFDPVVIRFGLTDIIYLQVESAKTQSIEKIIDILNNTEEGRLGVIKLGVQLHKYLGVE